jgi:preprotein translocase subunit YajC
MATVIVIAIVLVLGWFLLAVPQRRRARMHAAMQDSIEVGDEIITAGGLHAVVRELGDSELRVEIAPNVVATLDRRAVAAVAEEIRETPDESPKEAPTEIEDETPSESR